MVADDKHRYAFRFDPIENLAVATHSGKLSKKVLIEAFDALHSHTNWVPGMKVLVDFREADHAGLSGDDLQQVMAHISSYDQDMLGSKVASVVDGQLAYGMSRVFFANADIDGHPVEHGTFESMDAAKEWLGVRNESEDA